LSGRYPFLFSIPHGGVSVPPEVRGLVNLSRKEIVFNSDPYTRLLYGFNDAVEALVDFEVSRIFVDTNRAPYEYPPRAQDGVIKVITQDGTPVRMDAGRPRPLFCLSNRGDRFGKPLRKGGLVTCLPEWLSALARSFQAEFDGEGRVAMNDPFRGGFITVAHHQRTRTPWIQIEINRDLYETEEYIDPGTHQVDEARIAELRGRILSAVAGFWEEVSG